MDNPLIPIIKYQRIILIYIQAIVLLAMLIKSIIYLVLIFELNAEKIRFDNYGVYKVHPKNEVQIKLLQNLMENNSQFDFWNEPVSTFNKVLIMSDPTNLRELKKFLDDHEFEAELTIPNVQT